MATQSRILVIGAGSSGLAAIKSCKEESLDVTCYEKTKHFGGRWRYSEHVTFGQASIMKSTVCLSSKEMESFSDFPPPSNFPSYLHHTKMLEYLTMYAEKFDLISHIKFQRDVKRIVPSPEYDNDGKWLATTVNRYNNSETTEEFDGVIICTGRLSEPAFPSFPKKSSFGGMVLHSQSLRNTAAFEDLKVLVVGSGNSAVDAAVEISTVAQQVYLSTRNGFWVFPKLGPKGLPFDMHLIRRDIHFLKNICSDFASRYVEKYLEAKINHEACKIKPSHRALDKQPVVNDDLPDKILTGRIIIKGNISSFKERGVIFDHEDNITELDAVIFATGYSMNVPFLEQEIYRDNNGLLNLYKWVFPVEKKHTTLAFVGFVNSNGPQVPIFESQSRWVSRIFSKKLHLPSKEVMDSYIALKLLDKKNPNEMTVDYIKYMDELAEEYGVKPNISSLLFKDSELFWSCFTGPFLPYQYRLVGPNMLQNAKDFILDCEQRIKESFKEKDYGWNSLKHKNQ